MNPENPIQSTPSAPESVPPSTPVPVAKTPSNSKPLLTSLSILLLLLVSVVAFLAYQNWTLQKQISSLQSATPPTPIATSDPTANWKKYTDTTGRFSLKYPDSYFTFMDSPSLGFTVYTNAPVGGNGPKFLPNQTDAWLTAFTTKTPQNQTIDQQIATNINYQNATKTLISMDGSKAYKITYAGQTFCAGNTCTPDYSYDGVVVKDGVLYTISLTTFDKKVLNNDSTLFDQVLSTFKFTEQTTPGWTIYTNPMYKYSIQYPSTWHEATSNPEFVNVPGELAIIPPNEETPVGVQAQVDFVVSPTPVGRYSFNSESDFNNWINKPVDSDTKQAIYKIGNVKISGINAVQLVQQTLPNTATEYYFSIITWFRKDNNNYYIELGSISNSKVNTYKAAYDQILSTFKFQ